MTAIHRLDAMALARGVQFTVQYSFELLKETVEELRKYDSRIGPHADPAFGGISTYEGFWIAGLDSRGQVATMNLVRFFDWPDTDLFTALTTGRFFERDPARPTGAKCHGPSGSITTKMFGRFAHPGGIWVHPDRRGEREDAIRLTRILSRLSRTIAVLHGDIDHTFSFVEVPRVAQGKPGDYGYSRTEPGWVLHYKGQQPVDFYLVTTSRAEIYQDAQDVTRGELKQPGRNQP